MERDHHHGSSASGTHPSSRSSYRLICVTKLYSCCSQVRGYHVCPPGTCPGAGGWPQIQDCWFWLRTSSLQWRRYYEKYIEEYMSLRFSVVWDRSSNHRSVISKYISNYICNYAFLPVMMLTQARPSGPVGTHYSYGEDAQAGSTTIYPPTPIPEAR
jgi:hypothetical protein